MTIYMKLEKPIRLGILLLKLMTDLLKRTLKEGVVDSINILV
jgi:hypothetical protein